MCNCCSCLCLVFWFLISPTSFLQSFVIGSWSFVINLIVANSTPPVEFPRQSIHPSLGTSCIFTCARVQQHPLLSFQASFHVSSRTADMIIGEPWNSGGDHFRQECVGHPFALGMRAVGVVEVSPPVCRAHGARASSGKYRQHLSCCIGSNMYCVWIACIVCGISCNTVRVPSVRNMHIQCTFQVHAPWFHSQAMYIKATYRLRNRQNKDGCSVTNVCTSVIKQYT